MKVFLIRHAESEENALDYNAKITRADFNAVLLRSSESPLTERGEQQAREVITRMEHQQIDRLYSSPMKRALRTAAILGETLALQPVILENLREVLPAAQPERGRPTTLRRHFVRSYTKMLWPFGDDENWASAYLRSRAVFQQMTAEPADEIAAVAHRGTIGVILFALRRSRTWRIVRQDLSNGGVSIVVRR
ncbi:MAG: histidine phosphatase family protein [Roseiflexaceae bacterium]|nr:histidine phosphatase family protein [Roseiflexaceae bacterium]